MNWREFPFVKILPAFLAGLIFGARVLPEGYAPVFFSILTGIATGFAVLQGMGSFGIRMSWNFFFWCQAAFFFLGIWRYAHIEQYRANTDFNKSGAGVRQVLALAEEVRKGGKVYKVQASVYAITDSIGRSLEVAGKAMFYLDHSRGSGVKSGNLFSARGYFEPVMDNPNPGAFNYAAYLRGKRIYYSMYSGAGHWSVVRQEGAGSFWARCLQRCRQFCLERLQSALPGDSEYAIGAALLIGNRENMESGIRDIFSKTGAMHILAVSGLHVGMIAWFLGKLLQWVPLKSKWIKGGIEVLGIWGYTLLCGLGASVVRAAFMFTWLTMGRVLGRPVHIWNTLGGAAFFLLLIEPLWVFDIGFQLSFIALAGILVFEPLTYSLLFFRRRLPDYLWKLTAVGCAAQLATAPLSIFYFHQFPLFFWLSGWVAVPVGAIAQAIGALYLLLGQLPWLGDLLGYLLSLSIKVMHQSIYWIDQIPGGCIEDLWLSEWGAWCSCCLLILLAWVIFMREKWALWLSSTLLLLAAMLELNRDFESYRRTEVICFGISSASAIEFWQGREVLAFLSGEEDRIEPQTTTFHISRQLSAFRSIAVSDTIRYEHKGLLRKGPLLIVEGRRFFIWDGSLKDHRLPPPGADYWLLCNSPFIPRNLPEMVLPRKAVIADGSNSGKSVRFFKKYFLNKGITLHVSQEEGAWQLKLNPSSHEAAWQKLRLLFPG